MEQHQLQVLGMLPCMAGVHGRLLLAVVVHPALRRHDLAGLLTRRHRRRPNLLHAFYGRALRDALVLISVGAGEGGAGGWQRAPSLSGGEVAGMCNRRL